MKPMSDLAGGWSWQNGQSRAQSSELRPGLGVVGEISIVTMCRDFTLRLESAQLSSSTQSVV